MLREVFKKVKTHYGVTGKAISRHTGISESHISDYIRGKRDVTSETLDRMIEAMEEIAPGAKQYFCQSILGKPEIEMQLEQLVDLADEGQLEHIMLQIVRRIFLKSSNLTDEIRLSN